MFLLVVTVASLIGVLAWLHQAPGRALRRHATSVISGASKAARTVFEFAVVVVRCGARRLGSLARTATDRSTARRRSALVIASSLLAGTVLGATGLPVLDVTNLASADATPSPTSVFVPVGPLRVADTRDGSGFSRQSATTITVPIAGHAGVPDAAIAAALTISVTGAPAAGYVTVWPAGEQMPLSANVTFAPGETVSNGLLTKLGAGGAVNIYTSTRVQVIVDVSGAFVASDGGSSGRLVAIEPARLLDTRTGAALGTGEAVRVALPPSVPADAVAVVITLTTAQYNRPGYFTAFASGGAVPLAASLTVDEADSVRGATVVVPVSSAGLSVYSSSGGHLIVDFLGYFTGPSAEWSNAGLFVPMSPERVLDTRTGGAAVPAGGSVGVRSAAGVAIGNLTVTDATPVSYTHLTLPTILRV